MTFIRFKIGVHSFLYTQNPIYFRIMITKQKYQTNPVYLRKLYYQFNQLLHCFATRLFSNQLNLHVSRVSIGTPFTTFYNYFFHWIREELPVALDHFLLDHGSCQHPRTSGDCQCEIVPPFVEHHCTCSN